MALTSGKYLTKVARDVVVWRSPDFNGDAEQVFVDQYDRHGQPIGRIPEKDRWDREVYRYHAPEGFKNVPSFDNTANWVKVDDRGQIFRTPAGEAVPIREGQALVFNADGTVEVLEDEYLQYVFARAHDAVDEDGQLLPQAAPVAALSEEELLLKRLAEIREKG